MNPMYAKPTRTGVATITRAGAHIEAAQTDLARLYEDMRGDDRYRTVTHDLARLLEDARRVGNQLTVMRDEDNGMIDVAKREKARKRA